MSMWKKTGIEFQITGRSKIAAAIITGALAVFIAVELAEFFKPEVVLGKWQLLWSALCALGAGAAELISVQWTGDHGPARQRRAMIVLFLLLPVATLTMMEFLHGTFIYNWTPAVFAENYVFMLVIYLVFFAITGNIHTPVTLANILCYIFGMVNHFVLEFRGTVFVPSDIASAKTGMSVAGGYAIKPDNQVVLATALFVLLLVVAHKMRMENPAKILVRSVRIGGAAAALIFCGLLYNTDWFADHGMKPDFFNQTRGYTNHGSLFHFWINTKYLSVQEPKDYSAEEASSIVEEMLPAVDAIGEVQVGEEIEQMPNIICIMNETFSDLSVVGEFETNEDYMPYWRSLTENTVKGYVHVPVYGAGTANSEFEFLTGDSIAFLPVGACAYESYVKGPQPSLVSSLGALGYDKTAFHPYYGNNWSRDVVYPYLGFDRYADISTLLGEDLVAEYQADKNFSKYYKAVREKFPDENVFLRRYVSDEFDYHSLISMYEQERSNTPEKPFFMFNVTMQNHSGYQYTYSNFDQEIYLTGAMEGKYPKVDQYLSLIKKSDTALQELIEYYSQVDEPTIICVFGDHQPSVESAFYEELFGKPTSELTLEEEQKMYVTPFLIWANYDIEEKTVEDISLNYLSTLLLETAELPMTAYQQYLAELHKTLPVITTLGYMDTEGNWYRIDDESSPYVELVENYRKVQYNNLLDKQNRVNSLFLLPERT